MFAYVGRIHNLKDLKDLKDVDGCVPPSEHVNLGAVIPPPHGDLAWRRTSLGTYSWPTVVPGWGAVIGKCEEGLNPQL